MEIKNIVLTTNDQPTGAKMKTTIVLLAVVLCLPLVALGGGGLDVETAGDISSMLEDSTYIGSAEDEQQPYHINPKSKGRHQLDVYIRFNAIPYSKMIEIMRVLDVRYGLEGVDEKACKLKYTID